MNHERRFSEDESLNLVSERNTWFKKQLPEIDKRSYDNRYVPSTKYSKNQRIIFSNIYPELSETKTRAVIPRAIKPRSHNNTKRKQHDESLSNLHKQALYAADVMDYLIAFAHSLASYQ